LSKELCQRILEVAQEVGALKYGDFVLSSGAHSSYYFDGRLISLHPEGSYLIGKALLESLRDCEVEAVGGPALAAIPIVTAVSLVSHLEGSPIRAFFVRSEAKEHGTQQLVEGGLASGSRVAVVDDVCTSGGSLLSVIEAAEALSCKVAKVLVVLDRHQGGSDELRRRGYDFQSLLEADPQGKVRVTG